MKNIKSFKFHVVFYCILAVFPFQVFGIVSYQPLAKTITEDSFYLELNASLFTTTNRFDYLGEKQNLDEGSSFQKIDGELLAKYGLGGQLDAWVGTRVRQNSSVTDNVELTQSGMESYFTGLKYAFKPVNNNLRFAIDTQFRMTPYSNEEYPLGQAPTDQMILGDDGTEIWGRALFTFQRTKGHSMSGAIGYNVPPGNLSHEIIYTLESAFSGENMTFLVGVNGVYSLRMDEFGDPTLKPSMSTGETYLYNSIDREYIAPFLGLKLAFREVRLGIFGSKQILGVSTDEGYEFKISFAWQSEGQNPAQIKIDRFKEYHIQASVIKVTSKGTFIKIDQGAASEVVKGMKFDIYKTDYFGGNKLVASGVVLQVGNNWAIVKVFKKYGNLDIEDGFTARGY